MARLASLMEWKPGTVVADVGAGDGRYSFAAAAKVGSSGRVYATEIDEKKLEELRRRLLRCHLFAAGVPPLDQARGV
jgi:ubiquinone/menaquinone biosynthesis C-methylase UbiE